MIQTNPSPGIILLSDEETHNSEARGVLVEEDGNVVVSVWIAGLLGVARLDTQGLLDKSFGAGGIALSDVRTYFPAALDLAADGGYLLARDSILEDWSQDVTIIRFTAAGEPDPRFSGGGTLSMGRVGSAQSVAAQPDGRIVVAAGFSDWFVARFKQDGSPDWTFGSGGIVDFDVSSWSHPADWTTEPPEFWERLSDLALQADGKIVVAGELNAFGRMTDETGYLGSRVERDFLVARYNPDGSLDTSFGLGGIVTTDLSVGGDDNIGGGQGEAATSVTIQPDGAILAIGSTNDGVQQEMALARYLPSGALDPSFGIGGVVSIGFNNDAWATDAVVQSDGKILVVGTLYRYIAGAWNLDAVVVRLNQDGSVDTSFGTMGNGAVLVDLNWSDAGWGIALQSDGKIVVSGEAGSDVFVARYDANGIPDADFGRKRIDCVLDIDGDGVRSEMDLSVTEAWRLVERLDTQRVLGTERLTSIQERIDALRDEAGSIDAMARLTLANYLMNVASLGGANTAGELIPAVGSIAASIYNVFFQGEPLGAAVEDAWLDVLDVLGTLAKEPLEWLPLVSLVSSTRSVLDQGLEFEADLLHIRDQIAIEKENRAEVGAHVLAAIQTLTALYECLDESAAAAAATSTKTVSPEADGRSAAGPTPGAVTDKSVVIGVSQPAAAVSGVTSKAMHGEQPIVAMADEGMPEGLYIAVGTEAHDTLVADGGDADAVYLVSPAGGDDQIHVTSGSVYIEDVAGEDTVVVLDEDGLPASAQEITFVARVDAEPLSASIGIADWLYLATTGIERFLFADGEYLFVGDELVFFPLVEGVRLTAGEAGGLLVGGLGHDTLDGGPGADILAGGLGDDTYLVDDLEDVVVESEAGGTDTVGTTLAAYSLASLDDVEGLAYWGVADFEGIGNDRPNLLSGGAGHDTLIGGLGNDTLWGGLHADIMAGGPGDDTYWVDDPDDQIVEEADEGNDTIRTTLDSFSLAAWAQVENLVFVGVAAIDARGNALANRLVGDAGDDRFAGGAGSDSIEGLGGVDLVRFEGARADFEIASGTPTTVTDLAGIGGTDVLSGVERLRFDDATIAIDTRGLGDHTFDVVAMFNAAFDAVPSAEDLARFLPVADTGGDLVAIAQAMLDHYVPQGVSNFDLVAHLYVQLFGGWDQGMIDYYAGLIGQGLPFATQAHLCAAAAQLPENTEEFAELIVNGVVLAFDSVSV